MRVDITYLDVHLLSGESSDVADGTGSSTLELDSLESLVHVQSVVSASRLQLSLSFLHHRVYQIDIY